MGKIDVVITGIGLVTPVGNTIESFWESVSQGKPRIPSEIQSGSCDRFILLALDAAEKAVRDADFPQDSLREAGVTVSSSKGGTGYMEGGSTSFRSVFSDVCPYMAAVRCAERFGCCGPVINVISACATGLGSIIIGTNFIKTERAKVVLAGGTDACLGEFMISAYDRLGVLSRDLCLPYDRRRTGFRLSEGAGIVILEEKNHALQRGARVYGEITGWANLNEGYHVTSINPDAEVIKEAIKIASSELDNIDYINTHGTGTVENDIIETLALKKAFGKRAYKLPMSSTKAVTGHMLGASGAVEFIVGLLAMKQGFIPPTANLSQSDPRCDLDYVPVKGRKKAINRFLTLSYGFGGHVCAVEVRKI